MNHLRNAIALLIHDALPAGAWAGAAQVGGAVVAAPTWLIAIGQTAIVVIFTLKGIDRRLERMHKRVNDAQATAEMADTKVDTLHGQLVAAGLVPAPAREAVRP